MGNQLVGIAPSQIFPVERYLTDYAEYKFDLSLGSTRFFKVARAESQEGLVVVKVFVIHDPSLPLQQHKDQLELIRKKLSNAVNCVPFQKMLLADRAGLILREYVKYSLYDRISTRPFLTNIEKRWITFQVLYALHQCHKVGVCHGDIKLENITITAWNWVLLVDFAPFKPTFVPEDNPADYSYFFDTSRRRTCYLAPERFTRTTTTTTNTENSALITETMCLDGDLTPAMDIFSAGCALLELWNELHVPFEYSQLLAYRAGTYTPIKHLEKLEDENLKALIQSMLEIDPNKRLSAEHYLAQERGRLFPEYFFTFLQSYMLIFSSTPLLTPDEKICRLKNDIVDIFRFLGPVSTNPNIELNVDSKGEETEEENTQKGCDVTLHGECEGIVLIIALVTSCIRGLHDCTSKLYSLEILLELAQHANDETILDRILPFVMHLASDSVSRVKIAAIHTITKCLNMVHQVPRSDSNIFPEYILPGLAPFAIDTNTCVRAAYARNISTLAEISLRYLDQIQTDWYENYNTPNQQPDGQSTFNYDLELQALHEMVQQTVSCLLSDSQGVVKQTLIESDIIKLCVFFGKHKANDVLLSHMITFLNDKEDKELRGAFFDCIIGVVSYIGWQCSSILTPLLLQGLTDSSEFVAAKSINAMSALTELGLLAKSSICELISESISFVIHPNLWIRHAMVGFVTTTTKTLSVLDVQCKILPHLSVYMKYAVIQIDRPELLFDSLIPPIPRTIFDSVVTFNDIDLFLNILNERKTVRDALKTGGKVTGTFDWHTSVKNLFRRLEANGMTEQMEEYLLKMESHLRKIQKHKVNAEARNSRQYHDGKIDLSNTSKVHSFFLGDSNHHHHPKTDFTTENRRNRQNSESNDVTSQHSNPTTTEWPEIVITKPTSSNADSSNSLNSKKSSRASSPITTTSPDGNLGLTGHEAAQTISVHERSYIQYHRSSCYLDLTRLKQKQHDLYTEAHRNRERVEQAAWKPQLPPPDWKLRGALVAHLHEHHGAVNKLCTIPEKPLFASCSTDGYVRLWDVARMEAKSIFNRSQQFHKTPNNSPIISMTVCQTGQSLGTIMRDGSVNIIRLDPAGGRMNLVQTKQLDTATEGYAVDVNCLDAGSAQNLVIYATLFGSLVGWDLRMDSGVAWRLENRIDHGFITTFCLDQQLQSWLTVATSNGVHTTWDLRFQLPVQTIKHPNQMMVKKIISHPVQHSWIISSANEISMWNLETRFREKVLWGNTTPPLSKPMVSSNSVYSMLAGCVDRTPFLITGGTDQRLRFWNLDSPNDSYLAIGAASDPFGTNYAYKSRLIDGTQVIYEESTSTTNPTGTTTRTKYKDEELPRSGPEQPPTGHKDCISDIQLCKASQCYLVSASKDGVIKVWK